MKSVVKFVTLIIALFACGYVGADDRITNLPVHTFKAGVDTLYFDYEEPSYMEEDGVLFGIAGEYTYHGANRLMFGADVRLVWGELDYDGQTQDGTPVKTDTEDVIYEMCGFIGLDFYWPNDFVFTPFVGIGYRYWNDDIIGRGGYEREISYLYAPLGVKLLQRLNANWSWGLNIEYDLFLGGQVESHLSDAHPALNDVENDQDFADGYGVGLAIEINRKINERLGLSFQPYVKYWDIDQSNASLWLIEDVPVAYGVEPANETTAIGIRVYLTF